MGELCRTGWMLTWCGGLTRSGLAKHGVGDLRTGVARDAWASTGRGSDAEVTSGIGTSPFTAAAAWASDLLLANRGERDTAPEGLRSTWAGLPPPDACLMCRDRVGVECDGTGGDIENSRAPRAELASRLFDAANPDGTGEVDPGTTAGGLHCSDTHCTCPGSRVLRVDGDRDPEANFSRPRPRLWPTAADTATKYTYK